MNLLKIFATLYGMWSLATVCAETADLWDRTHDIKQVLLFAGICGLCASLLVFMIIKAWMPEKKESPKPKQQFPKFPTENNFSKL